MSVRTRARAWVSMCVGQGQKMNARPQRFASAGGAVSDASLPDNTRGGRQGKTPRAQSHQKYIREAYLARHQLNRRTTGQDIPSVWASDT
jgi:hypothetical protein